MEDICTVATLVKNITLGRLTDEIICNELFFGCVLPPHLDDGQAVVFIEKRVLFDAAILPEERKQDSEEDKDLEQQDKVQGYREEEGEVVTPLCKKDFWMTNKIVQ